MATATERINFRISQTEKAQWELLAQAAGLSLSEWIRSKANGPSSLPVQGKETPIVPVYEKFFNPSDAPVVYDQSGRWKVNTSGKDCVDCKVASGETHKGYCRFC